jgi:hypothetical protein
MARGRSLLKEAEWRARLARFARAGMSIVAFCSDEGVSTPAFYAWRRRLAVGTGQVADTGDARGTPGPFAVVRVREVAPEGVGSGGGQVTVWLRGGTRLQIPLADPSVVGTVLGAILHADAETAGGPPC